MANNNIRILLVDDEERIRRLLKMYLEREEFIVEEAGDGNTALTKALENDYDAILLDLMTSRFNFTTSPILSRSNT